MIRPLDNDDAILRWNRCARLLQSHPGFHEEREVELDALDSSPGLWPSTQHVTDV
jgi:hypothetical protein